MKLTTTTILAALCVALVNSVPVPEGEGFQSQALDRLMMVEADNEAALRSKRTIGILRQLFPDISKDVNPEAENQVVEEAHAESQNNEVRVQFADEQPNSVSNDDSDLTPLDDVDATEDDENRNKRFLGGNGNGSGGGSGNFLFDIIRLVAGGLSGASGGGDPAAGAPSPGPAQEAIPGPVTRLFVIANRGISNLIQDLILRLAATSERVVNFKARLITSLI